MKRQLDGSKCVHCGSCSENCSFLKKYHLDIGDHERLRALSYHCFLCGECTRVCPIGIDGRQIILNMRKEEVERAPYRLKQRGYLPLLIEKKNYIFKNYRRARSKKLLFPGCNFPSFFPKTMALLSKLLKERAGIDTVYDCCGKPIAELGLFREEERILERMNRFFEQEGIEELVLLCPNCYYHFGSRLSVKITTIYEKLSELGDFGKLSLDGEIFLPCPDREKKEWMKYLSPFLSGELRYISDVQCCGLGGCAIVKESELAKGMAGRLGSLHGGKIYTYCGTCAGNFARNGNGAVRHFLPLLLKSGESADFRHSWTNRLKTRFL